MVCRLAVPFGVVLAAALTATPAAAQSGTRWVVDPVHSQVDFRVRHLLGRVRGTFTKWYAVLDTRDADWTDGTVRVTVQTSSLDTGNRYRDDDLRSERFFAVQRFPKMTFDGTGIVARDSTVEISGMLTLKGKSHPVTLVGQYRGILRDAHGQDRIAFDATTTLDRRDYDISYNEAVAGKELIGNDVEITIAIEAVRAR
jgi:polyisoprenoid-binding protein YceI